LNPDSLREIVVVVVLLALYALFSAAEAALVSVRKMRLTQFGEEDGPTAARIERLTEDPSRLLATSEFGATITSFLAVASAAVIFTPKIAHYLAQLSVPWSASVNNALSMMLVIIVMSMVMLLFGKFLPKRFAHQYAKRVAFLVAGPFDLFARVSWPIVRTLTSIANWLASRFGAGESTNMAYVIEEEILTIVDAGEEDGFIEEDEREMIYSIFEFGDTLSREIMLPRIDVVAVEVNTPMLEALDVIMEASHSRVPVYSDTMDNIEGLLYAKDILSYLRNGRTDAALPDILRPAYFVPETKKVNELLADMQQRKMHMAIVVDEYGGTAGLVTIEDIIEEIVGEIQDEYDSEEDFVEHSAPGEIVFNALVNLDDASKLLGVVLPTEGGETLGGLIYSELGCVPSVQDEVVIDGVKLTVLSVAGRRIMKVKATRIHGHFEDVKRVDGRPNGPGSVEDRASV
jgi:putative hemolysin